MLVDSVGIIGSGAWGTSLAIQMNRSGLKTLIYSIEEDIYKEISEQNTNSKFLPGVILPKDIKITQNLRDILNSNCILIAVPSFSLLKVIKNLDDIKVSTQVPIVIATKGLDSDGELFAEKIKTYIRNDILFLSGANIAIEIANHKPASFVLASDNYHLAQNISQLFNNDVIKVYPSNFVKQIQISGSIKNIAAILSGITSVLYNCQNLQAWLATLAFNEVLNISKKMGCNNLIDENSNIGILSDLILCCYSTKSRNYCFGRQLVESKKERREIFIKSYTVLVEGKNNAFAVKKLLDRLNFYAAMTDTLCLILNDPANLEKYITKVFNN